MNRIYNTKIILIYGVPGAGKSRLCSKLSATLSKESSDVFCIETDFLEKFLLKEGKVISPGEEEAITSSAVVFFSELALSNMKETPGFLPWIELFMKALKLALEPKKSKIEEKTFETIMSETDPSFSPSHWNVSRSFVPLALPLLLPEKEKLKSDYYIIIDDNLLLKSCRKDFKTIAKRFGCGFAEILVEASLQEAINNNQNRDESQRIGKDVITKSFSKLEEGTSRHSLSFRSNSIGKDCYFGALMAKLMLTLSDEMKLRKEPDLAIREEDIRLIKENVNHQVDLMIREINGFFLGGREIEEIFDGIDEVKIFFDTNKSKKKDIAQFLAAFKKNFFDLLFPSLIDVNVSEEKLNCKLKDVIAGKQIVSATASLKGANMNFSSSLNSESCLKHVQETRSALFKRGLTKLSSEERVVLMKRITADIYIKTLILILIEYLL